MLSNFGLLFDIFNITQEHCISYLNLMESVDPFSLAGDQPGWIQALNSDVIFVGFSFNISSVFTSFACSQTSSGCVPCIVWPGTISSQS